MKIHFDNVDFSSQSGPNTFASRLARRLGYEYEQKLVSNGSEADVSLVFIEPSGAPLAPKIVQRLDGIWFKPKEFEIRNTNIKRCYDHAAAVIWQSDFDRGMTTHWWGQPKHGRVVHNGIDINPITEHTIPALEQLRQQYEMMFVCSSNWHPQKRLRENIEFFGKLQATQFPSSCLIVMGANPDYVVSSPHIFYTGSQPHQVCLETFSTCNWMIHLAWLDHCPNVVIEALSQGTPVICSSTGGTKELVQEYGLVIEDEPYNYELTDYDSPPRLQYDESSKLPSKEDLGDHCDITIERAAREYMQVLESVVG